MDTNHYEKRLVASESNPEMLFADGFEEALTGVVHRAGGNPVACYDMEKCIEILVTRDGMTREEAEEFFDYNVIGAYAGENTPCFHSPLS